MSPLAEFGVLIVSMVAGILGSMVGLGGGVFIVPIVSAFFGVELKTAIAASAVSVVVNSLSGSTVYLRYRMTNARLGLLLLVTTTVGAIAGGLIAVYSSPNALRIIFSVSLVLMSIAMLSRPPERKAENTDDPLRLRSTYHDPVLNTDVTYTPRRIGVGMAISSAAGLVSGMLGIGGGAIQVPVMNTIMRVPVKAAVATSVWMVGTTIVASAMIYYVKGYMDPSVTVPAVLGVLLGAQTGSRIARRIRSIVIVRILIAILLYLSLNIFLQAIGIKLPGTK